SKILGRAALLRCDHCRGQLGVTVQRYWRMRFCSTACISEYQQRLSTETQLKVLTLITETIESGAVQLAMFSSWGTANEEPRPSQRSSASKIETMSNTRCSLKRHPQSTVTLLAKSC